MASIDLGPKTSIKITLAVDRSRNRVLFADVGSDFVDVLLSFLTLPLSAVQFCAAGASSPPGCLSNLCDSVNRLRGSKLLTVEACHGMLLTPKHGHEFGAGCISTTECNHNTFGEKQPNLQVDGTFCRCWLTMATLVHVYGRATSGRVAFVRCKERFLISDDWTIKPAASTSTIQSLIDKFSPDDACLPWF